MDRIENMRAFLRVVECGTFTAAAASMNSTTGAVSRAVSDLECHLRTRLLNRSTRRLALTDSGTRYLARCRRILEDVDTAEAEAANAQDQPSGKLRMHSYASIGQHYVLPAISRYRKSYPAVSVELTLLQKSPDLFDGSSDVAVVTAPALPDSDLISHHIGSTFNVLCTSREYVMERGMPEKPTDLLEHDCLLLQTPSFPTEIWSLEGPDGKETLEVAGPVQTNIAESLLVAVNEGMGIASVPVYAAIDGLSKGTIIRVLPSFILQKINIYAIYPSRRYVDAKIRTWIEFLREQLPAAIALDEAVLNDLVSSETSAIDRGETDKCQT